MKALRKLLQRTPFYGAYKSLGHYPDYWYWKLRGEPIRSPHLVKQRAVREYAALYGLRTLVETGTYYGEMVSAMRKRFYRIYSVEFDSALAHRAQKKFAPWPHVHILEGDSRRVVPELIVFIYVEGLLWIECWFVLLLSSVKIYCTSYRREKVTIYFNNFYLVYNRRYLNL